MSQALYRTWRPQTWGEVVGQDHVVQTLRNAVRGDRVAHAYLFAGPRGTGKTTTARLLAKAVNCLTSDPASRPCNECHHCLAVNEGRFLDLIEIDAASNTSVEDVRELRDRIHFSPAQGQYKVYIIDEVHMLSSAAFNALLKTLEEPPPHAIFVLATTEVHKIPATVISRCQRHEFRRLPASTIVEFLSAQCAKEGLSAEREALMLISRQATGSLRDAISLLDQLASTGDMVTLERVQQILGTAADEAVRVIVKALADQDIAQGLTVINRALDGGADPRQLARQIVEYLREVLLSKMGGAAPLDEAAGDGEASLEVAPRLELSHVLGAIHAFVQAASEGRPGPVPGLPLEIAFLEALHVPAPRPAPGGSTENPKPVAAARTKGTRTPPQAAPKAEKGAAAEPSLPKDGIGRAAPGGAAAERRSSSAAEEQAPSRHMLQPATRPESDPGPGFQAVMERWKDVLQVARQREPRIQALLNSCRPLGVEEGILVLGFRSDLLREKMEKGQNLVVVSATLQQVFQAPMGVRCVLLDEGGWDEARLSAPPALEDGGMVATALKDLGAHVVDVTPEPPESG